MCYNPALVRDKPLGAPASVKLVYYMFHVDRYWINDSSQHGQGWDFPVRKLFFASKMG